LISIAVVGFFLEMAPVAEAATSSGDLKDHQIRRGGCCRCARRSLPSDPEKARLQLYHEMVAAGRQVDDKNKNWYEKLAWWSDVKTKAGGRIFALVPRGPKGELDMWIDMWELLCFAVGKMHEHVVTEDKPFAIVWCQFGDHRLFFPTMSRVRSSLHPKFAKNFEALHVVHPSWGVRLLRLTLWPIAPDEFWDAFHAHERVEFLDTSIVTESRDFRLLPRDVYEHDKWLDQQSKELNEQAKQRGGFGGMGGLSGAGGHQESEEEKKAMEELRRLLEAKGNGSGDNSKLD